MCGGCWGRGQRERNCPRRVSSCVLKFTNSELGVEGGESQLPAFVQSSHPPNNTPHSVQGCGGKHPQGQAGAGLGNRQQGSWAVLGSQAVVSHLGCDANEAWPHAESRSCCARGGEPSLGGSTPGEARDGGGVGR